MESSRVSIASLFDSPNLKFGLGFLLLFIVVLCVTFGQVCFSLYKFNNLCVFVFISCDLWLSF